MSTFFNTFCTQDIREYKPTLYGQLSYYFDAVYVIDHIKGTKQSLNFSNL
jgi:hypothetical protein